MQAKSVLYAAVGAPVVAARKVSSQMTVLKDKVTEEKASYTKVANEAIDGWAVEGEKVVTGIREGKVVEEISQKVDLDQAKEQVSKLRDQLEDMLATWRQSFRPEKANEAATKKPAAKAASSKPATKASAAGTASAKSGASASAAKTSTAKKATASSGSKSTS